ncbi:hypothetical protein VNO78_23053 [Psophocarpus tetragonolobus]|uniref:Uncharacterized protein n=1 Tax=Psophocarpus tetragonolobus TaxID=3891 RepID=A0AAN9XDB0_PSOTE
MAITCVSLFILMDFIFIVVLRLKRPSGPPYVVVATAVTSPNYLKIKLVKKVPPNSTQPTPFFTLETCRNEVNPHVVWLENNNGEVKPKLFVNVEGFVELFVNVEGANDVGIGSSGDF